MTGGDNDTARGVRPSGTSLHGNAIALNDRRSLNTVLACAIVRTLMACQGNFRERYRFGRPCEHHVSPDGPMESSNQPMIQPWCPSNAPQEFSCLTELLREIGWIPTRRRRCLRSRKFSSPKNSDVDWN